MNRGDGIKYTKRKNLFWSTLIVFVIVILIIFLALLRSCSNGDDQKGQITVPDTSNESVESIQEDSEEKSVTNSYGTIAIPGYEALTLQADEKKQRISFNNPEQNKCYFVISLYLSDGTLLWKSDYVKPGSVSKAVVLSQTLSEGTYKDCLLKYECFAYDTSKKQLNGAETKVTLIVK